MKKLLVMAVAAIMLGSGSVALAKDKGQGIKCPETWDGNKCEYFKDGYRAGRSDRKANMSMAYERHAGKYDSRFEEAFRVGYEAGWQGTSY